MSATISANLLIQTKQLNHSAARDPRQMFCRAEPHVPSGSIRYNYTTGLNLFLGETRPFTQCTR